MKVTFVKVNNRSRRALPIISDKPGVEPHTLNANATATFGPEYTEGRHFKSLCRKGMLMVMSSEVVERAEAP